MPHLQASSFWSSIVKAPRTGLTSPLYPCGCQLLGERRAPPWKRAGEARRTLMSRSPATHQCRTVALPMISQHLPLLSRAGLSKPTHTHTHTHARTHARTQDSARHHTIRQLSSPSSPPVRVLPVLVPRKAWEMRRAGSCARSGYRTSDSDTDRPCWDSGGGRNPCQHALLRLPGLGSGTAIVRDSTPTSLLPAAQLPGHGSLDLTDLI